MVDQAKIEGNGHSGESPTRAVARGTGEFLQDVFTLSELQAKLLLVDLRQALDNLLWSAIAVAIGGALGLACLPVALVTIALTIVETTRLSHAQAFGATLAAALLIAALLAGFGVWRLRRSGDVLNRSISEWRQNVKWVKDALRRLGSNPFRRGPSTSPSASNW